MFAIEYTWERREMEIQKMLTTDRSVAVILAAVHFEWMIKRGILKLSHSPTRQLRQKLEDVYTLTSKKQTSYKDIWDAEVGCHYRNAALGNVLGSMTSIQNTALKVRGRIIHGNGTPSKDEAEKAVDLYLSTARKIALFAAKHGKDLNTRLNPRRSPRSTK